MKKRSVYIPLFLMLLAPVAGLSALLIGYEWALVSARGLAAVFTLLFCASVLYMPKDGEPAPVAALCVPLAVVNLYLWLFKAQDGLVILLFLVCAVVSVRLLKNSETGKWWKIASSVVALVLFALYLVLLPIAAFGISIGHVETVDVVYSPNGVYRAELVDVDEGALGGATLVKVYHEDKELDFGFAQLRKKPQTVYTGPWGEFEDMELYWESDTVLRVDGVAYEIEED